MSLVVIRAGIDTLEATFSGELAEGRAEELDRLKEIAQCAGYAQRIGGADLHVEPRAFGFWRWRLTSPRFELVLSPSQGGGRPSAQVRLSALGLASHEADELYQAAGEALATFGDYRECGLSRLDVYADCQGWIPTVAEMRGVSCPATFRPVYPSTDNPQTFQFGKGDAVVRVYNKSAQIVEKRKLWWREVWRETGRWNADQDVWRVEAQLRTKILTELGKRSVSTALACPGSVFDWVLREWCQLRVPNGDQKVTRWPEHPVWEQLRRATFDGKPVPRTVRKAKLLPLEDAAKRLRGIVATAAAYYGEIDYIRSLQRLSTHAEVLMKQDGVEFAELVASKQKRLEALYGDLSEDAPF